MAFAVASAALPMPIILSNYKSLLQGKDLGETKMENEISFIYNFVFALVNLSYSSPELELPFVQFKIPKFRRCQHLASQGKKKIEQHAKCPRTQ